MSEGLSISWTAIAGFAVFVAVIAPGFYWIGRLSHRVDSVEDDVDDVKKDVERLYGKIDAIHYYVKNGRKKPEGGTS